MVNRANPQSLIDKNLKSKLEIGTPHMSDVQGGM